uniref:Grh/CP2 DB domain-containing protein n=1 Tax=Plectus sambesii TaxID=2011161 RepID=A0A914VQU6_9BILA
MESAPVPATSTGFSSLAGSTAVGEGQTETIVRSRALGSDASCNKVGGADKGLRPTPQRPFYDDSCASSDDGDSLLLHSATSQHTVDDCNGTAGAGPENGGVWSDTGKVAASADDKLAAIVASSLSATSVVQTGDYNSVIARLEAESGVVRHGGGLMKLEDIHGQLESVLVLPPASLPAASMSQFQIEGVSSVIKTAPGRQNVDQFSPKGEAVDLAPLTQASLQDLSKMQPVDYYSMSGYPRVYPDYAIAGLAPPNAQPSLLQTGPSGANLTYYHPTMFSTSGPGQEWNRQSDPYAAYAPVRPLQPVYSHETTHDDLNSYRLNARNNIYKPVTVDMPSPVDSGIGGDINIVTPNKDGDNFAPYQMHGDVMHGMDTGGTTPNRPMATVRSGGGQSERSMSHRESPVNIPKLHNTLGFQYVLEAPISTSIRKEDDHMTYVNKGQFYTASLDYIPDPCKPLKSQTVKSILMVVFREDKSYEEEIKTWQFWHARQHSVKQRILEVDAKNSSGAIGQIEEIAHNAVQFYWNPSEQNSVKISVAVQCLSTDFSNQKGVKGLPLHIQIDTYDEAIDTKVPFHRGYCQIKVFCDKGAERKLRDEDKRAQKRKLAGRKKSDGEYHEPCDRSEFYHMSDLEKPAALFIGPDEYDPRFTLDSTFPGFDAGLMPITDIAEPAAKRARIQPTDRVMLYVRKREEHVFTPLHLVPPSLEGLLNAVVDKFALEREKITGVFKQCRKGVTVKVDDEMLKHYCNEDTFVIQIDQAAEDPSCCTITLVELEDRSSPSSMHSGTSPEQMTSGNQQPTSSVQPQPQTVQVQ